MLPPPHRGGLECPLVCANGVRIGRAKYLQNILYGLMVGNCKRYYIRHNDNFFRMPSALVVGGSLFEHAPDATGD